MSNFDPLGSQPPQGFAPPSFAPGADQGSDIGDMSDFAVDFTGVGDWSGVFEPLDPGTYTVNVFEAKPGRSQAGHPKVTLTLKLDPQHHPDLENRQLRDDLSLTPGGMPRTKSAIAAVLNRNMDGVALGAGWWNDLLGHMVQIIVDQEGYVDKATNLTKVSNKVKGYLALQGVAGDLASLGIPQAQPQATPAAQTYQPAPGGITI